jgi:hypothetical protein
VSPNGGIDLRRKRFHAGDSCRLALAEQHPNEER